MQLNMPIPLKALIQHNSKQYSNWHNISPGVAAGHLQTW
jgi:hypothetical protein